ncbi:TPA: CHAP domain-containing protein [Streptococcus suis]|nr:CHAP domain-containing protein [Streptococcus suis]HEM3622644.1 CHAP domain-containing protein [Streptococcus suis]HEM3630900.1 CHAP domain-containing protein [Streptococcus suis]HEM3715147.1 CHAP domain-containing protein [Streptococcus suis]
MTTANDVVNFVTDLANRGQGVDYDGWYGNQCVDLPNWICGKFFGKSLWGNAIDLIKSAKQHGFEVHYMPTSARPRPGAIFVKNYWAGGTNYGHTGVIIGVSGDTVQTIEQNLVGNLSVGGPAQYSSQQISNLVGWFYPPYSDSTAVATQASSGNLGKVKDETGKMVVKVSVLNVRDKPGLDGKVVDTYKFGDEFYYDEVYINDGYIWVSYIGKTSGQRRYVAAGEEENRCNVVPYGQFI